MLSCYPSRKSEGLIDFLGDEGSVLSSQAHTSHTTIDQWFARAHVLLWKHAGQILGLWRCDRSITLTAA